MSRRPYEIHVSNSPLRYIDNMRRGESKVLIWETNSYKGMAMGHPKSASKVTPQSTGGFSQVGGRPGASNESASTAMSVLLSWHEKVVEVAGLGCIGRTMTDWRKV